VAFRRSGGAERDSSMARILILGIDGMDWPVLEPLLPELENIGAIGRSGFIGEMSSIFPPDSIPSWVSIFTGLDPSEHGVLETIDYFKKDVSRFAVNTEPFKGKTFWDLAGRIGKKAIVVNPLLAHPPWEINGIMASGPVFVSGETSVYPASIADRLPPPPLGGIVDFPEKGELSAFMQKTRDETARVVDYASALLESEPWDLSFVTLLTLDRVFHFFWRYFDAEDPTYPGPSNHSGAIADFHRFLDSCIGRLMEAAGPETMFMILSDHGHGRRPPLLFNLNQLLLEEGFLESRIKGPKIFSRRYHLERAKNIALEALHRLDMEDLAYRFARVFPWTRKMKKRDFMTEPSSNIATASQFGGTNPFGGVDISKDVCTARGLDYESVRERIIRMLETRGDERGQRFFKWVRRREEIYGGPFIDKFPDILYQMEPQYGTNWSLHLPLVTMNPRHKKISGGHRASGVLAIGPLGGLEIVAERLSPVNVCSTILTVLQGDRIDDSLAVPGRSFLEIADSRSRNESTGRATRRGEKD
jgi:predicted AlkP superfamily phosphohydrolase/phosphomutase